jgi:hypothetical protein
MKVTRLAIIKAVLACLLALTVVVGGGEMLRLRHYKETIVKGPGVTGSGHLSDYFPALKGTWGDTDVFYLDSGKPGATALFLGGTHPNEPSGVLAAFTLIENARVETGRLIIIPRYNRSGSTATQPMGAYPEFIPIKTAWGEQTFRMGDRLMNPLDQWPDPEVYLHYPTKQMLSNVDMRNVNRTWPGRPDGALAERVGYAAMELIRKEKVDWVVDFHGAELLYPVTNCIVAPDESTSMAQLAAMNLTATTFEVHVEPSPSNFRGVSHREIGDHSDAFPFLLESPDPFLDQPTGPKTVALELDGKDDFLLSAAKRGLLFTDYDESGKSMDQRAGRHVTIVEELARQWNDQFPDRPISFSSPGYEEFVANGVGSYFLDPSSARPGDVVLQ